MNGPEESDDDDRQLAEQRDLERQWLATDPGYLEWLDSLNNEERE